VFKLRADCDRSLKVVSSSDFDTYACIDKSLYGVHGLRLQLVFEHCQAQVAQVLFLVLPPCSQVVRTQLFPCEYYQPQSLTRLFINGVLNIFWATIFSTNTQNAFRWSFYLNPEFTLVFYNNAHSSDSMIEFICFQHFDFVISIVTLNRVVFGSQIVSRVAEKLNFKWVSVDLIV